MECLDSDYQTAELIGNKLMLHMASAYRLINGAEQPSVPAIQPLDQRRMLLSLLPPEFETKTLLEEAKSQGIPRSTVFRWNDIWVQQGKIVKLQHGIYKKAI